ncbi:MAG: hypothetical protein ACLQVD_01820 [Capsulimonadaceae bacterium]
MNDSINPSESAPRKAAARAVLSGTELDHRLGDLVARRTETAAEAAIDAANGLRGRAGRRPVAADFEDLESPEDVLELEVVDEEHTGNALTHFLRALIRPHAGSTPAVDEPRTHVHVAGAKTS